MAEGYSRRELEQRIAELEKVTEQYHRLQRMLQARLQIMSQAGHLSIGELLRLTLDEVERLTGSCIGFYHFVGPDQKTLTLQMWSTRTLEEFCTARADSRHYDIDKAGVWVDGARRGEPVVHNDYQALPNRKGMPPGHAPVVRELVVPIIRNGSVVAILGVGNKDEEYSQEDVETVSSFADLAWHIVENKQALEQTIRREQLLRLTEELTHAGSWLFDNEREEMFWTEQTYLIHGLEALDVFIGSPELVEKSFGCFRGADRQAVESAFAACRREGKPYDLELPFRSCDGEEKWVRTCARPVVSGGAVRQVIGTIMDITARKLEEQRLKERENLYRALIEGLPDVVMRLDRDGRHLFVSRNVSNMVDLEPADYLAKTHRELGFPEDQCQFWDQSLATVFRDGNMFETEFAYTGDGESTVFNWRILPEFDAAGAVQSVLCIARDVTSFHRLSSDYQILFQEMLNGCALHEIICDEQGKPIDYRFLAINPAFEELTGLKASELVGRTVLEVLPGLERQWIDYYGQVALTGKPLHFTGYSKELDKHYTVTAFQPAAGQFACLFEDITSIKKAEQEKGELEEQYRQALKMESIGRLAGGVAHDLNNLLAPILGFGEMLLEDISRDDPRRQAAKEIVDASNRAAELVRQLLAFSRKQALEFSMVDMNKLLINLEKLLRRAIRENIEITFHPAASLPMIRGDVGQIEQVVMNLAVNAQDAMPDGGSMAIGTAVVRFLELDIIEGEEVEPGEYVLLAISDTGCGIDPEVRKHIFEPFYTTKRMDDGTGLGLATVYGVVRQHNGVIRVDSELEQGTTFEIYFPAAVEQAQVEQAPVVAASDGSGEETILVVEDNKKLKNMVRDILRRRGYRVFTAGSGGEAYELVQRKKEPVDLMITDVVMPDMDGKQLGDLLRPLQPRMQVLYMSGYPTDVIAKHGILVETVDMLAKPFSITILAAKVREILSRTGSSR